MVVQRTSNKSLQDRLPAEDNEDVETVLAELAGGGGKEE